MTISNEAEEAAAKGVFDKSYAPEEWDEATTLIQERYRYIARAALEAAAPFIRACAIEDAANQIQKDNPGNHVAWLRARAAAERGGE